MSGDGSEGAGGDEARGDDPLDAALLFALEGDAAAREAALRILLSREVALLELGDGGGPPDLLRAPAPAACAVQAGEEAVALYRDAETAARALILRGAEGRGHVHALPLADAARRVLAAAGPVRGAALEPEGRGALFVERWELARLARGEVLPARAQGGAAPRTIEERALSEGPPEAPVPPILARRIARLCESEPDVFAAHLVERRVRAAEAAPLVEIAGIASAGMSLEPEDAVLRKLRLYLTFGVTPALPDALVSRIFAEVVPGLIAPDEPLQIARAAFHHLSRDGRYAGAAPLFARRGLGFRIRLARGIAWLARRATGLFRE